MKRILVVAASLALSMAGASASAATIFWTDWTSATGSGSGSGGGPYTAQGTITTGTSTFDVTYTNPQGIGFDQLGDPGDTDYWAQGSFGALGRNPALSPYTSADVDNIPTGTDILALRFAGSQTLSFSEVIANPVFSYVSLNGNGYAFDQDFEILSFGNASQGNDCGYWGCGTSFKNVVDLGGGNFEYQLLGTGEPHGTLRFTGAFDEVSWRSLSNEFWNGFTVGVQGTALEVFGPTADANGPYTFDASNLSITLDGSGSTDPDNDITTYSWAVGASEVATGEMPSLGLADSGLTSTTDTGSIDLTVTDATALASTDSAGLSYVNSLPIVIDAMGTENIDLSMQLDASFDDSDLLANALVAGFEMLEIEISLVNLFGSGFITDMGAALSQTIDRTTLEGLLGGGAGNYSLFANVRDKAGTTASLGFDITLSDPTVDPGPGPDPALPAPGTGLLLGLALAALAVSRRGRRHDR